MNGRVAYKIGHTKYFNAIKRFHDPQYSKFGRIVILADIYIQHKDPRIARLCSQCVEVALQAFYPKNFRLEEHFSVADNTFSGLSGITEMFILEDEVSEQSIVDAFERIAKAVPAIVENFNV